MYSNNSYNIFTKSTVNKSTITVDTCTLHRQRHEVTAYTQQSLSVDRPGVEIGPDVEQISLDALVIRASTATDNHICSVSSEHNLHVYIARFVAVYCNRPRLCVCGSVTGAYAGGADGAEAPRKC